MARIAQSVQRLATGWTGRGPNPGGKYNSHTRPDRVHPTSCTIDTGVPSTGKATGERRRSPIHTKRRGQRRSRGIPSLPSVPSWQVTSKTLTFFIKSVNALHSYTQRSRVAFQTWYNPVIKHNYVYEVNLSNAFVHTLNSESYCGCMPRPLDLNSLHRHICIHINLAVNHSLRH